MSNEDLDAEVEEDGEAPKKRISGKVLVLFIILPLLLVLIGGGAAAYFLLFSGDSEMADKGHDGGKAGKDSHDKATAGEHKLVFFDMLVNMNTSGRRKSYLKLKVSLELESADMIPQLEAVLPRIIDSFNVYLRELRLEDLKGSAGLLRLKEELLLRINVTARPVKVKDVLFKEMLVQ